MLHTELQSKLGILLLILLTLLDFHVVHLGIINYTLDSIMLRRVLDLRDYV